MLTSVPASAAIIVLAFILFVLFSFQGVSMAPAALVCAFLVSLATPEGPISVLTTVFLDSSFTFAKSIIFPFAFAGLFSELMSTSGSSKAVGLRLVHWLGANKAPLVIALITAILNLAGITPHAFIVATLAFSVLKAANLPRAIGVAVLTGVATVMGYGLPGVPTPPNYIPTTYLGTDLYAAPVLSLVVSAFGFLLIGLFTFWQVHQARANHIGYDPVGDEQVNADDKDLMSFGLAALPIAIVVVSCFIMQKTLIIEAMPAVSIALLMGCLSILALHWKKIGPGKIDLINRGMIGMFAPVVGTALIVGFASTVQLTSAYQALLDLITTLQLNPYVTTFISIMIIALVCANGVSGLNIFMATFGVQFAAMDSVNNAALHRLAVVSACTLDSMPHNAAICMNLSIFKLSHKEGYFGIFINTVVITTLMALLCMVLCIVMY